MQAETPGPEQRFLMNESPTFVRYRIVLWLTVACALAYLCRNATGVTESSISAELGLNKEQSGYFMGAFFWAYAVFQVPCATYAQRVGTRFSLTLFALIWSLSTLTFGLAQGIWLLVLSQIVMGIAQAGMLGAMTLSVSCWIPITQRSLSFGLLTAGMQVGAVGSGAITGRLLEDMTWRWAFVLLSIPGIVWSVLFCIRFRNTPDECPLLNPAERELIRAGCVDTQPRQSSGVDRYRNWGDMIRCIDIWLLCGQQCLRSAGYIFFANWFPTFLQTTRGVSIFHSGVYQSWVLSGALLGCLIGGWVIDRVYRLTRSLRVSRCGIGAAGLSLCGLMILCAGNTPDVTASALLFSLGIFFASFAGPALFSTTVDLGGGRISQLFAVVNMCGNFATAATIVGVGMLFDATPNWNIVIPLFAGIYITGGICWAFVNPHRHQKKLPPVSTQIEQPESVATVS